MEKKTGMTFGEAASRRFVSVAQNGQLLFRSKRRDAASPIVFFAGVMFAAWTLFAAAEGPGTYFVPPKGTDNVVSQAVSRAGDFNVRDYPSVAAAAAACRAAGGGRIVVPKGEWKTGKVHLSSNCELHLEDGAELVFSDNPKDCLPAVASESARRTSRSAIAKLRPDINFWRLGVRSLREYAMSGCMTVR